MKSKLLHLLMCVTRHALIIIFIQCIAYHLLLASETTGQTLSEVYLDLRVHNASLEQIFCMIEEKTSLEFAYGKEVIKTKERFSLNVRNENVTEVLKIIGEKIPLHVKHINNTVSVSVIKKKKTPFDRPIEKPGLHDRTITGKVTDAETDDPLPGVNVIVPGGNVGTITNVDGTFSISVPEPTQKLNFSLIGYEKKEVEIGNQSVLDIKLSVDITELSEVVITALGVPKIQKSLGYSIEQIEGEKFEKVKTDNFMNQLNGMVAGLTINSRYGLLEDPIITLRGRSPIIIVDGIPVDSYKGVAPDEIENISVLKGPQAAVLYGSRGKDGAILITTKKAGRSSDLEITFNSSNMVTAGFLTLPETQSIYGAGDNGEYAFLDGLGNGVNDGGWIWGPKLDQRDPSTPSGWWETTQYNSPVDPETGELIPLPWRSHEKNLQRFLQEGIISNNHIGISKRVENGGYRIGLNQMYRRGMVPNTRLNGLGMHLAGDYDITPKLHSEASLIYNNLFSDNYPMTGYDNGQIYYNILIYMGPSVDIMDLQNYWQEGKEGFQQRNHNYTWFQNPWFIAYENEKPFREPEVLSSFSLDYDFNDDLNLQFKAGHNYKQTVDINQKPYAWVRGGTGNYIINSTTKSLFDANLFLAYKKSFGGLGIDAMLGGNWNQYNSHYLTASTSELVVPNVYNLSNSKGPVSTSDQQTKKRMLGAFGTATFSWKDKLFVNLTGRNDWSSSLAKTNRSYFYPSVSISGIVSEWVSLPRFISYWQLKSSWAQVGRDMDPYQLNPVYDFYALWDGKPAYSPSAILIDPDIEPSQTTSIEYGTDIRFFEDALGLNFTYFNTKDDRWIQEITIPETSGFTRMLINGNVYKRTGFEIVASATPISTTGFNWNTKLTWFTNKTILEETYDGSNRYGNLKIGDRTDAFIDNVYLRQPGTDNFVVDPNTGRPIQDPFPRLLGHQGANWEAGFSNTFSLGNFTVDFLISGRWGGMFYSDLIARMIQSGAEPRTTAYREAYNRGELYLPENAVVVSGGEITYDEEGNVLQDTRTFTESETPLSWRTWMSDFGSYRGTKTIGWNVNDASFFKLRSLSIAYDFSSLLNSNLIKRLEGSLIGSNLLIWKKMPHEDPDTDRTDLGFPTERYIGLNLKVTL